MKHRHKITAGHDHSALSRHMITLGKTRTNSGYSSLCIFVILKKTVAVPLSSPAAMVYEVGIPKYLALIMGFHQSEQAQFRAIAFDQITH